MEKYKLKRLYLWGGIGNVLYQVNFALYLIHLGYEVEVSAIMISEKGFLARVNKHHKGTLDFFLKLEERLDIRLVVRFRPDFRDVIGLVCKKLSLNLLGFKSFDHVTPNRNAIEGAYLIIGYFQGLQWRSNLLSKAVEGLITPEFIELHQNILCNNDSLVVHLRFGDKENDEDFFLDIRLIERLYRQYKRVSLISDNPKRVDMYIESLGNSGSNVINYCSISIVEDFLKLYMATNVALSRSSFSWWAAELSPNNLKIYEPCPFYSHLKFTPFSVKKNKVCYEKL
jgi:hypothetical protein